MKVRIAKLIAEAHTRSLQARARRRLAKCACGRCRGCLQRQAGARYRRRRILRARGYSESEVLAKVPYGRAGGTSTCRCGGCRKCRHRFIVRRARAVRKRLASVRWASSLNGF